MNNKSLRADMMLLFVTICWGVSYYMTDICLTELKPFTINTYRFVGAFLVAAALSFPKLRNVNFTTIKYSMMTGLALYFTYLGSTFGVLYTKLTNVGFLCALAVVIVPILDFFFKKRIPSKKIGVVIIMCLVGIGLLTLTERLTLAVGDLFCILCSLAYAVDMVLIETAVSKPKVNPYQLGVFQLMFTGIFCLITALITEDVVLPSASRVWISIIFLMVFCTGLAFIIQCVAQQYTSATHVGIIFALEPVFATVVAYFFAGESLSPRGYVGAAILMIGFIVMEVDFKKIFKVRYGR